MDEAHEPALRDPTAGEGAEPSSSEAAAAGGGVRPAAARRRREQKRPTGARNLLIAASAVVVIAGLKAASAIIIPFLVALFIAALSLPLMTALTRRGWTPGFAVLVTIAFDLAVLVGLILVVSSSVNELVRERAKYERRIAEFRIGLENQIEDSRLWLEARGIDTHSWFEGRITLPGAAREGEPEEVPNGPSIGPATGEEVPVDASGSPVGSTRVLGIDSTNWLISLFDVAALIDTANAALRGLANTLANTLIVILITTFVLLEAATFPQKLRRAFGNNRVELRFGHILFELRRYLSVKAAISAATGLIVGVWVGVLGVDFAPLWALLAFALNFIPNLGSIIAAVPPVLLALVQQGFGLALLVAVGYLAVNVIIGNFVEPQVMGRRLGLSTLVVFLSLVFWGWVWGPVGMLLSVPLTMVVKILLENSRDFRWMAILLEGGGRRRGGLRPRSGRSVPKVADPSAAPTSGTPSA